MDLLLSAISLNSTLLPSESEHSFLKRSVFHRRIPSPVNDTFSKHWNYLKYNTYVVD